MIVKRVVSSTLASRGLSYLLQSQCKISTARSSSTAITTTTVLRHHSNSILRPVSSRFLSSTGSGGGDDDDEGQDTISKPDNEAADPFGVSFEDGDDYGKVGPPSQLPPKYKRDAATGKLTGDVEAELTAEERELLQMDPLQRDRLLLKRLVASWDKEKAAGTDGGDSKTLDDFARRVRLAKMSLNVLGRSVKAQGTKSVLDDGDEFGRDKETGFTQHLTKSEFATFQKYMRDQHKTEVTEEDIPVHDDNAARRSGRGGSSGSSAPWGAGPSPMDDEDIQLQGITDDDAADPDNPDLSLKWLTSRANWEINKKYGAEHPFEEMLPRDLNIRRIVNRKRAKILPRELLHHNNLALLRRYISPAGQIMHRVRTRLGARDQRKISKLIKRARNLGLIPHSGQFVVEDHGNIYEKDIRENKPWEEELIRRGLVVKVKEREMKED